ncbi:MAG TPA: CoA pyrophosphatase [Gemmatimonadales bacterium]|nr:CoA pyrophosphatase [Gemmatimonadales bacterium]
MRLSLSEGQRRLADQLARRTPQLSPELNSGATLAAVAVLLVPDPDAILLIRRAERADDPWSGHIGLPGGRPHAEDADPCATAMRETMEEVGINLARTQLIGQLDDVWPRTPLPHVVVVRPFVFGLPHRPPVIVSDEVAEAFWVTVEQLRDSSIYRQTPITIRGNHLTFPAYHLGTDIVWGLTERILTQLFSLA